MPQAYPGSKGSSYPDSVSYLTGSCLVFAKALPIHPPPVEPGEFLALQVKIPSFPLGPAGPNLLLGD